MAKDTEALDGWEPFSKAPKDGTPILVVDMGDYDDRDMYLTFWYNDRWQVESIVSVFPLGEDCTTSCGRRVFTPTHWRRPYEHPSPIRVED